MNDSAAARPRVLSFVPGARHTAGLIGEFEWHDADSPDTLNTQPHDLIIASSVASRATVRIDDLRPKLDTQPNTPTLVDLSATTIEGILDEILVLGDALEVRSAARDAVVRVRERLFRTLERVTPLVDPIPGVVLTSLDPLEIAGHWGVQLIERCGGSVPLNHTEIKAGGGGAIGPQQAYRVAGPPRTITPEDLTRGEPQWLIVASCKSPAESAATTRKHPWFDALPPHVRKAAIDAQGVFAGPHPLGLCRGAEWLVDWLDGTQPDAELAWAPI